jgi:hypothetical protein
VNPRDAGALDTHGSTGQTRVVQVIDLAAGAIDIAAVGEGQSIELRAVRAEPDAVQAALTALRACRLKALRLVSALRAMPAELGELATLQRLDIVDAELPGLPSSIGKLVRLRELRLEAFHLGSLPNSIGKLTRLRSLHIESHHLCGLPSSARELVELRELTLLLHRYVVPDWEHPVHARAKFVQPLDELFAMLAGLPALTALTIGEPGGNGWHPEAVFDHLPAGMAELLALEQLVLVGISYRPVVMPRGIVMPGVSRFVTGFTGFDTTADELQAMFPNARISDRADT